MIIGISGKINSGKSLFAKILQYELACTKDVKIKHSKLSDWNDDCVDLSHISGFKNKSFALKIKEIVSIIIGCEPSQLEDQNFKEKALGEEWFISKELRALYPNLSNDKLTPRLILQKLGTDIGRDFIHPNIWSNALFTDYKKTKPNYPNWIITDMRFKNDNTIIKSLGGFRVRIERENLDEDHSSTKHKSETDLDQINDFDLTVDNNHDIENLHNHAKDIIAKIS